MDYKALALLGIYPDLGTIMKWYVRQNKRIGRLSKKHRHKTFDLDKVMDRYSESPRAATKKWLRHKKKAKKYRKKGYVLCHH